MLAYVTEIQGNQVTAIVQGHAFDVGQVQASLAKVQPLDPLSPDILDQLEHGALSFDPGIPPNRVRQVSIDLLLGRRFTTFKEPPGCFLLFALFCGKFGELHRIVTFRLTRQPWRDTL